MEFRQLLFAQLPSSASFPVRSGSIHMPWLMRKVPFSLDVMEAFPSVWQLAVMELCKFCPLLGVLIIFLLMMHLLSSSSC